MNFFHTCILYTCIYDICIYIYMYIIIFKSSINHIPGMGSGEGGDRRCGHNCGCSFSDKTHPPIDTFLRKLGFKAMVLGN